jgi:hypothetical protein
VPKCLEAHYRDLKELRFVVIGATLQIAASQLLASRSGARSTRPALSGVRFELQLDA